MILKNTTNEDILHTGSGFIIPANGTYEPSTVEFDLLNDAQTAQLIDDGDLVIEANGEDIAGSVAKSMMTRGPSSLACTLAVDLDGSDFVVSTDDWTDLVGTRVIWDANGDYDSGTGDIVVPATGYYNFDVKLRVTSFANVDSVELAIFKRGTPDDYWFICDRKYVDGKSELILSTFTQFDFIKDERYCLKIKLTKALGLLGISASVDGDDDYTAWGFNLAKKGWI